MSRSLSELLQNDLSELAYLPSNVVASEEAIRLMLNVYSTRGELTSVTYVHKENLGKIIKASNLLDREGHYQFFIEVGERSKLHQGQPEAIHYCALDLFIRLGHQPIAFVADHYRGFRGYYQDFEHLAKTFNIQFVVAGGSTYQADNEHCLIFSLHHLLLTAADGGILELLDRFIATPGAPRVPSVVNMPWDILPPRYMLNAQSVAGTLFKYVDKIHARENIAANMDTPSLVRDQFSTSLSKTLVTKAVEPDLKVFNYGVKYCAAHYAGQAALALEIMTANQLVQICYQDRYPLVNQMLNAVLALEDLEPVGAAKVDLTEHPLFEFAFYHAHILENFLVNQDFCKIFNHSQMLISMQKRLIDPRALFAVLTSQSNKRDLEHLSCSVVCKNLGLVEAIIDHKLDSNIEITSHGLIELMKKPTIISFINHPMIFDLFKKGLIPLDLAKKIKPHLINPAMFHKIDTNEGRIRVIMEHQIATSDELTSKKPAPKLALKKKYSSSDDEEHSHFDLFDVPEVPVHDMSASLKPKPKVNIGLLAHALSSSLLFFPADSSASAGGVGAVCSSALTAESDDDEEARLLPQG